MTNFILPDGTVVDTGQEWSVIIHGDSVICKIQLLFPTTERIILEFDVNVISSLTLGQLNEVAPVTQRSTWDLDWSSFVYGYGVGTLCRYLVGTPTKRIPPMGFI